MRDWMLPHITDYWDERVQAIERLSRVIESVPEAEREAQLSLISTAVGRHVSALSEADIVKFTVPVAEDLYKAVSNLTYFDQPLLQYLDASCGPFFHALTARGYMLHYFIDNTWDRLDGPAIGFPMWFRAAGLLYICPQEIACHEFEKDKPPEEWPALVTKYISDGRVMADELANRSHSTGRHFVYLDIDPTDFAIALKLREHPGVIHVFRREAPAPKSHCFVFWPAGPRTAHASADALESASAQSLRASAPTPVAAHSGGSAGKGDLKPLIDGLVSGDEETRRGNRRTLEAALSEALANAADLDALKADVEAFRNAGWVLIGQSNYAEGEYTLAAAIRTVTAAVPRLPQLKSWLPLLIEPRLKTFMQHPVADLNEAAWSALDSAIDEGMKLAKSG